MSPRLALVTALAVAVLPEILRLVGAERERRHQARESELQRAHDAAQREADRENARLVAEQGRAS